VPDYADFQGKVAWHPDDRNTVTLLGVGGVDRVSLEGGDDSYSRGFDIVEADQWQYAAGVSWKRLLAERGYSLLTVHQSQNDYRYDLRDRLRAGATPDSVYWSDSHETETGLRARAFLRLAPSLDLMWSGEVRHVAFEHQITAFADTAQDALPTAATDSVQLVTLPRNDVRRDDAGTKGGVFASLEKRYGAWTMTAALRWDGFDYGGQHGWSPRGGLTRTIGSRWTARATAGVFHQTPAYTMLTQTPAARHLPFERALHYVVGADTRSVRGAQATSKRTSNSIATCRCATRGSQSRAQGREKSVASKSCSNALDRWYGLAAYSGSRSNVPTSCTARSRTIGTTSTC
jgi:hypothetical protein